MARIERHHILEILSTKDGSNGDYGTIIINSHKKLKELGLYGDWRKENYGLPSWMICTLSRSEHHKLHRKFDKEWSRKNRESKKGCTTSFFGMKFKEHYGITSYQDRKLYYREMLFYRRNGYLRWEQEKKGLKVAS